MEFLTNNLQWSAASVADLYRCRWQIEVFFKQIKQSLQLCDFLGNSANAVRWQVWTPLLLYVLMRFLCVISSWNHSFTRLFTLLRAAVNPLQFSIPRAILPPYGMTVSSIVHAAARARCAKSCRRSWKVTSWIRPHSSLFACTLSDRNQ